MSGLCWATLLDCIGKNHDVPRPSLSNAVTVLQHDPAWGPDTLYYDEFLDRIIIVNSPTRQWRDDDDTRLTVYMQQTIGILNVPESIVSSAVRYVSRQRTRHCVRDYLDTLTWDGVERIAHAFEDFWGAETDANQPSDYVRAASANFLIGSVARIYRPGCQLDTMPVFEGLQGLGKSSLLRALGGPWYMAATESVNSKDFQQSFPGSWFTEIPELDSFSRADRDRVKSIISTPIDKYRPSYGRYAREYPRQCVFAGTTNKDDWGNDDTGLRRFWPVRCGRDVDVAGLIAARDQLFAEAVHRFKAGATWWEMPSAPTLAVQRDRQSEDIWTPLVLDYLVGKAEVQVHEVLREACKVRESEMTHTHKIRIGGILRLAQWQKSNLRRDGKQVKTWVAPDDE
jgi:putative DNA primase/helicase